MITEKVRVNLPGEFVELAELNARAVICSLALKQAFESIEFAFCVLCHKKIDKMDVSCILYSK